MRIVPARNGWLWLVKGFALFRRSPAMWLALVLAYWIIVGLLAQIQYVGLALSTVLLPAFSVSFMIMCAVLDRGGALACRRGVPRARGRSDDRNARTDRGAAPPGAARYPVDDAHRARQLLRELPGRFS